MTTPAEFFAAMAPMLAGRTTADDVEARLGGSPSGTAALGFYAELVRRNLHKILSDVFPATRALVRASAGGEASWVAIAADYARAHPATGADPNRFAAHFSQWLGTRAELSPTLAELADYEWARLLAYHALDDGNEDDDAQGFGRRIFVRQYSADIPALHAAIGRGTSVDAAAPRPTITIVFRHAGTNRLGTFHPGAAGLAALAQAQGLPLPSALAAISAAEIEHARGVLVGAGVLFAPGPDTDRG